MSDAILDDISHRRYNPLRGTWIMVSPHRAKRPWQGQMEASATAELPEYEPTCYLCPGNKRAQGGTNPNYDSTYVFVNDYSAVKEVQPEYEQPTDDEMSSLLLKAEAVTGKCHVVSFSPKHNLTLADVGSEQIASVLKTWTQLYASYLSPTSCLAKVANVFTDQFSNGDNVQAKAQYKYMQIFENTGAAMGCSSPHPHGQIWTTTGLPEEPTIELEQLMKYKDQRQGANMLEDYAALEIRKQERLVFVNHNFVTVCPWWATWPYEVMIVARNHRRALVDFNDEERKDLADAIADVGRRYDNLFETRFPYCMGLHQAPLEATEAEVDACHFHVHFYPPLLRSATVRKFLVGYEMMAEPHRDITPEQAAARLRGCGGELYRNKKST